MNTDLQNDFDYFGIRILRIFLLDYLTGSDGHYCGVLEVVDSLPRSKESVAKLLGSAFAEGYATGDIEKMFFALRNRGGVLLSFEYLIPDAATVQFDGYGQVSSWEWSPRRRQGVGQCVSLDGALDAAVRRARRDKEETLNRAWEDRPHKHKLVSFLKRCWRCAVH